MDPLSKATRKPVSEVSPLCMVCDKLTSSVDGAAQAAFGGGPQNRVAKRGASPASPAPPAPSGFSLQLSGSRTWPELGLRGGSGASCQDNDLGRCSFPLSFTGSKQCEAASGDGHCYLAKANVLQGLSCQEKTQLKPLGLANFMFFLLPVSLSLVTV